MKLYDLTLPLTPDLPLWPGDPPLQFSRPLDLANGDDCSLTHLSFGLHSGTHLDAPAHFIAGGAGVESLSLHTLIGPAWVAEAPTAVALTADLFASLNIPPGSQRLLVKTSNSARWAAGERQFYEDFVAVTADGARWLVDHGVRLIGVDYLSVATFADTAVPHRILLQAGIIPVEGLNLHAVPPGPYQLVCLPLLIPGSDGAPCRVVLMQADE